MSFCSGLSLPARASGSAGIGRGRLLLIDVGNRLLEPARLA
jgi:hypothetical protein